jgi:hypothetical protein
MRAYLIVREESTYLVGEVFAGRYARDTLEQGFREEDIVTEHEAEKDPELRRLVEAWQRGDDNAAVEDDARYEAIA